MLLSGTAPAPVVAEKNNDSCQFLCSGLSKTLTLTKLLKLAGAQVVNTFFSNPMQSFYAFAKRMYDFHETIDVIT